MSAPRGEVKSCASSRQLDMARCPWLYWPSMRTIPAGQFKNTCLKTLDEVAQTRSVIVITKRGRPVAKLVPCGPAPAPRSLAGGVLREVGDPFGTGEPWDADPA